MSFIRAGNQFYKAGEFFGQAEVSFIEAEEQLHETVMLFTGAEEFFGQAGMSFIEADKQFYEADAPRLRSGTAHFCADFASRFPSISQKIVAVAKIPELVVEGAGG